MQNGSLIRRNRKKHLDIWQFRWWEKISDGKRIYRRRQIGTVDQIPDLETAREAARLLVPDLNARIAKSKPVSMTIAQLCSHFEQCELSLANTWRRYSTKTIYKVYLKRIHVRLANLVELDCVAAAAPPFPMLDTSVFETYPPDV
jgi:integrase